MIVRQKQNPTIVLDKKPFTIEEKIEAMAQFGEEDQLSNE